MRDLKGSMIGKGYASKRSSATVRLTRAVAAATAMLGLPLVVHAAGTITQAPGSDYVAFQAELGAGAGVVSGNTDPTSGNAWADVSTNNNGLTGTSGTTNGITGGPPGSLVDHPFSGGAALETLNTKSTQGASFSSGTASASDSFVTYTIDFATTGNYNFSMEWEANILSATGGTAGNFPSGTVGNVNSGNSFFISPSFGASPTAQTVASNNISHVQGAEVIGWTLGPTTPGPTTFSVPSAGLYTFKIGDREAGMRIDRFAFTLSTDTINQSTFEGLTDSAIITLPSLPNPAAWVGGTSTDWGTGPNWSPSGIPASTSSVVFGDAGANATVNLGSTGRTTAGIQFNSSVGTTVGTTGGPTLTIDQGTSDAPIFVQGTHSLNAPIALNSNLVISWPAGGTSGWVLTLGGNISDGGAGKTVLIENGGTVNMNGSNTYTGSTTVSGATVTANNANSLGAGTVKIEKGGILEATNTFSSGQAVVLDDATSAVTVDSGKIYTNSGVVSGAGNLIKSGNGTLVLQGSNTYTGDTTLNSGVIQMAADNALGAYPGLSPSPNVTIKSATLDTTASLSSYRDLTLGNSASTVQVDSGIFTSGGRVIGTGMLNKTGAGALSLNRGSSATYSGGTTISNGTVIAAAPQALGSGSVTLAGGTLALAAAPPSITTGSMAGFGGDGTAAVPNTWQINNTVKVPVSITGDVLQATDGNTAEWGNAFNTTPVPVSDKSGFIAAFTYQSSNYSTIPTEGVYFVLQNSPSGASAPATAALTGGMPNSLSVGLDARVAPLAISVGGTQIADATSIGSINLKNSTPIAVTLTYLDQSLTEAFVQGANSYSVVFNDIDLETALGGQSAYVGFGGFSGDGSMNQTISNFTFGPAVTASNFAATYGNNINLTVATGTLDLSAETTLATVGSVTLNGNTLLVTGMHNSLAVSAVSFGGSTNAWTGKIDLGANDLIIHGGNLANVTNQIKQGFNGGHFNGSGGIVSSAAGGITTLGVASGLTTFDGQPVLSTDVLVKYTYYGDANLDGVVDGSDYSRIDNSYLAGNQTGWLNGDFNYDNAINGSDYTLIDNAFNSQGAQIAALIASPSATVTDQIAGASSVPEPTTLGLLGIGAIGLLGRRNRQRGATAW